MLTGTQLPKFGSSTLLLSTGSSSSTVPCWTLKMEAAHSSTMPVFVHQSTHNTTSQKTWYSKLTFSLYRKQDREQQKFCNIHSALIWQHSVHCQQDTCLWNCWSIVHLRS